MPSWIKLRVPAFGQPANTVLRVDRADQAAQLLNGGFADAATDPGGSPPAVPAGSPGGDFTTDAELAAAVAGLGAGGAAPATDAARESYVPTRLSDANLKAAYGRPRATAYSDPASQPGGTPTALPSGQATQSFGVAPITVSGGQYRHAPAQAANSAGYLQADLGARVGRIGADPVWPAGATGAIAFVLPTARWDQGSFPEAGIHFVMYRDKWHVSYWNGSGEDMYAQGSLAALLDDGLPHRVEVVLDGSTAYLNFPDGSTVRVDDLRIAGAVSTWAIWELYEGNGATDTPARFTAVWADIAPAPGTAAATPQDVSLTRSRVQLPATYTVGAPDSATITTITTGEVEVARSALVVPTNLRQWVRCAAYLELTAATQVYYQVRVTSHGGGGGQMQWQHLVLDGPAGVKGTYAAERMIDLTASGFTAGDTVDVVWNAWGTAADAGQIVADANRAKTMHLTPCV